MPVAPTQPQQPVQPVVHIYPTDTGHRLASTEWPQVLMISNQVATKSVYARLSWPYISIMLENGRALYKVSTCEQGQWRGDLIECFLVSA